MNYSHDRDPFDWSRFTGRQPRPLDVATAGTSVGGKRILVTGAGGFIGSALTKTLARLGPERLVLLDHAEGGLYQLDIDLRLAGAEPAIRLEVGSVGDASLIDELFDRHQPEIVFHAAACKHVPLMEMNPFAAASTNILGTERIVQTASCAGAEQCILLSTDKAADPGSIMGATKRIAELIVLAQRGGDTAMKTLRLGNVLGSSGSVAPLFLEQISRGGPVTVTHPEAARFFLSIDEAVQYLVSVLLPDVPSAILAPDMGRQHSIQDLAKFLVADQGMPEVPIVFGGLRPGDKLSESIMSRKESLAQAANGLHVIEASAPSTSELPRCLEEISAAVGGRDLHRLLRAIEMVVPEYRPSDLLQLSLARSPGVRSR